MIFLRWLPYPGSDVAAYRVYRSIIGFVAPLVDPASLAGLTLTLKTDGVLQPTVTFSGTDSAALQINAQLTGGTAYPSTLDPATFLFRSVTRDGSGSVEIVDGTALALLGLTPRVITEKSEDLKIATVSAVVDPTEVISFSDADGVSQDWYAVTTVSSVGEESRKTTYLQAITATGAICVLEGLISDLQGVRIADCEVTASIQNVPLSPGGMTHVTVAPITTLTGPDGRFRLSLLQGAQVLLEIPTVGFSQNIKVPAQPYAFITDLGTDVGYRIPVAFR